MANFDVDDPLGDLLSDGSNDSFFEEPKVLSKRASLTKTPEKKSVSELFGLEKSDARKDSVKKSDDDWLGFGDNLLSKEPEKPTSRPLISKPVKKISFEDADDILNTLGLDKKTVSGLDKQTESGLDKKSELPSKPEPQIGTTKVDASKRSSLMESILGPPKTEGNKNVTSFDDILKASQIAKKADPKLTNPQKVLPSKPLDVQTLYGASSLEAPREGRRSRQQALMDPLGLFSNEPVKSAEADLKKQGDIPSPARRRDSTSGKIQSNWLGITGKGDKDTAGAEDAGSVTTEVIFPVGKTRELQTKSAPNITQLPNWLGGSPVKTHKSDTGITQQDQTALAKITSIASKDDQLGTDETKGNMENYHPAASNIDSSMFESLMTQQKLAASHMEYQNSSTALQQQESQLLMALQLKKYEENLANMQFKQQEVLVKQEQQFNNLLERQFAKQQIMENNMKLQQERINNHIQMLLCQPPVSGANNYEEHDKIRDLKKSKEEQSSMLYEEMITALKQRTHEEAFLLEESYKKQISTLEQTTEAVEGRLKLEIDYLLKQQHDKIGKIQNDHEAEVLKYKQKIDEMTEIHTNEIKLIRENHNRLLEEIKYEYSTMVEHIKETKQAESALFQNSNEYSQKLDNSLRFLDINSKALLDIREQVEKDYGVLSQAREESLKAKEGEIKVMRAALEKSRESAEVERAQLIALVRNLEIKLAEQSQNSSEDRWSFQQAAAVLAARSAALDREAEFNRATIEREREQLKTFKESLLAEQEKITLQLTEERLHLSAERVRLETTVKLNQNYDSQRAKAEIDAAIQVAKEATEMTDRERETLHRQQCEIESMKRNFTDRERKLFAKERDLEVIMQNSERKAMEGERALAEARTVQANYNERLKDIQTQLLSLTNREKKLAEEKIALSKERLDLHSQIRQSKRCSLCVIDSVPRVEEEQADPVEQDFSRFMSVTDPELLRLRLQLSEEQLSNNLDGNYS